MMNKDEATNKLSKAAGLSPTQKIYMIRSSRNQSFRSMWRIGTRRIKTEREK